MKLPKHLHVFGEKYSLKRVSGLKEAGAYGLCKKFEKEIYVDSKLVGEDLHITLVHEIAHGALHEVGADVRLSEDLEEIVVDAIARAVCKSFDIRAKSNKKKN